MVALQFNRIVQHTPACAALFFQISNDAFQLFGRGLKTCKHRNDLVLPLLVGDAEFLRFPVVAQLLYGCGSILRNMIIGQERRQISQ